MANKRIFYASHAVQIEAVVDGVVLTAIDADLQDDPVVQGAQSVSINTNFSLEQIFQLGRLPVYDFVNNDPEVELTLSKVLDGYALIWNHALGMDHRSLITGANTQCEITLGVGSDTDDQVDAANADYTDIWMTGMFMNSVTYTFPTDGNLTEEVSFVGSHRSAIAVPDLQINVSDGKNGPEHASPNTTVFRRQNVRQHGLDSTVWPTAVQGRKCSSISVAGSLNREKMYALGAFAPFHRFVNFPIEITTTFETIAVNANNDASLEIEPAPTSDCGAGVDRNKEPIFLQVCDSDGNITYNFNLGSGNKLSSHSYSGGDTGGGNVNETFTYLTYNDLDIEYFPNH